MKDFLLIAAMITPQNDPQTNPEYTGIIRHSSGLDPYLNEADFKNAWEKIGGTAQHLHLISKRNPVKGDFITDGRTVYPVDIVLDGYIGLYKIEASTDKSLGVASIPKPFIESILDFRGGDEYKEKIFSIMFDTGGYVSAMHMDSQAPPIEPHVIVNKDNEVVFIVPCNDIELRDAAKKYAEQKCMEITNPKMQFTVGLMLESAYVAGAQAILSRWK